MKIDIPHEKRVNADTLIADILEVLPEGSKIEITREPYTETINFQGSEQVNYYGYQFDFANPDERTLEQVNAVIAAHDPIITTEESDRIQQISEKFRGLAEAVTIKTLLNRVDALEAQLNALENK